MRLFLLDPRGFLVRGQGVLLLLEGSRLVPEGHVFLLEGPGERGDRHPLMLEHGLHALELGLLRFEGLLLLLERRSGLQQLGLTCLGLLGLLVSCGSLGVALTGGSGQLLLQLMDARLQGGHLLGPSVGLLQSCRQGGIVRVKQCTLECSRVSRSFFSLDMDRSCCKGGGA